MKLLAVLNLSPYAEFQVVDDTWQKTYHFAWGEGWERGRQPLGKGFKDFISLKICLEQDEETYYRVAALFLTKSVRTTFTEPLKSRRHYAKWLDIY